jgi:hypothetical protein
MCVLRDDTSFFLDRVRQTPLGWQFGWGWYVRLFVWWSFMLCDLWVMRWLSFSGSWLIGCWDFLTFFLLRWVGSTAFFLDCDPWKKVGSFFLGRLERLDCLEIHCRNNYCSLCTYIIGKACKDNLLPTHTSCIVYWKIGISTNQIQMKLVEMSKVHVKINTQIV